VTLNLGSGGRPVEYGAIRISLAQLPAQARRRVLEEQRPLGNILQSEAIPHLSWPQAFFSVQSDSRMSKVLGLREPARLYGRRNVLVDISRRLLAEVIEVLAPVPKPGMDNDKHG
jgi:chorismate-pyruvate lyase